MKIVANPSRIASFATIICTLAIVVGVAVESDFAKEKIFYADNNIHQALTSSAGSGLSLFSETLPSFDILSPSTWPPGIWQVVGAIIVSLITNIFLISQKVYRWWNRRRGKTPENKEKLRADSLEAALLEINEEARQRIGYEIGELIQSVEIINKNGDCVIHYNYKDVKKVCSNAIISRIPGNIRYRTPGCLIRQLPKLSVDSILKGYEIDFIDRGDQTCDFDVIIPKKAKEIEFSYSVIIEKAHCMSKEELVGSYPYEWTGRHIGTAYETLILEVKFPYDYSVPDVDYGVCSGWVPNDSSYNKEVERIGEGGGIGVKMNQYTLVMKRPKLGYVYFIRWRPSLDCMPESIPENALTPSHGKTLVLPSGQDVASQIL